MGTAVQYQVERASIDTLDRQEFEISGARVVSFAASVETDLPVLVQIDGGPAIRTSLQALAGSRFVLSRPDTRGIERISVQMQTVAAAGATLDIITGDVWVIS